MRHYININVTEKIRHAVLADLPPAELQRRLLDWLNTQLAELLDVAPLALAVRLPIGDTPPADAAPYVPDEPAVPSYVAQPAAEPAAPTFVLAKPHRGRKPKGAS